MNYLPIEAYNICQKVRKEGGTAYIVGGFCRDFIISEVYGKTNISKDIDLEVFNIDKEKLLDLLKEFGEVDEVGKSFGVFKLGNIDISLPRTEIKDGDGHKGFNVIADEKLSIEEAARRRDFTINAVLFDVLSEKIIDPFNGRSDIESGIIRHVCSETFVEDSLRVLRAMQFSSRLQFSVEPYTIELCQSINLNDLPKERIWEEFEKMFLKSKKPSIGLRVGVLLKIIEKICPELLPVINFPGWLDTIDRVTNKSSHLDDFSRISVIVGTLLSSIWKDDLYNKTLEDIGLVGAGNKIIKSVSSIRESFDRPQELCYNDWWNGKNYGAASAGDFRRVATKVDPFLLGICAGAVDEGTGAWFNKKMLDYGVASGPLIPLITGDDLISIGYKSGKELGNKLKEVYELQMDGKLHNKEEALKYCRI